jgi:hypothetical protein
MRLHSTWRSSTGTSTCTHIWPCSRGLKTSSRYFCYSTTTSESSSSSSLREMVAKEQAGNKSYIGKTGKSLGQATHSWGGCGGCDVGEFRVRCLHRDDSHRTKMRGPLMIVCDDGAGARGGDDDEYVREQQNTRARRVASRSSPTKVRTKTCHLLANCSRSSQRASTMMMPFICSCRNNNWHSAIYPFGYSRERYKKTRVMMLPPCPLWYHDVSLTLLG